MHSQSRHRSRTLVNAQFADVVRSVPKRHLPAR